VFAKAKYIVTGDKALLRVNSYKDGSVITPKEFITNFNLDK
jgi:predicted nucleic acid-binding protein